MSERKNNRVTTKTAPMTFRFPMVFWAMLKEKHGLKTGNDAANFFQKLYEQTFCPIAGVPTHERQTPQIGEKSEIKSTNVQKKIATADQKPEKKRGLSDKFANAKLHIETEPEVKPVVKGEKPVPPKDLKGIDLSIWKRENGIK